MTANRQVKRYHPYKRSDTDEVSIRRRFFVKYHQNVRLIFVPSITTTMLNMQTMEFMTVSDDLFMKVIDFVSCAKLHIDRYCGLRILARFTYLEVQRRKRRFHPYKRPENLKNIKSQLVRTECIKASLVELREMNHEHNQAYKSSSVTEMKQITAVFSQNSPDVSEILPTKGEDITSQIKNKPDQIIEPALSSDEISAPVEISKKSPIVQEILPAYKENITTQDKIKADEIVEHALSSDDISTANDKTMTDGNEATFSRRDIIKPDFDITSVEDNCSSQIDYRNPLLLTEYASRQIDKQANTSSISLCSSTVGSNDNDSTTQESTVHVDNTTTSSQINGFDNDKSTKEPSVDEKNESSDTSKPTDSFTHLSTNEDSDSEIDSETEEALLRIGCLSIFYLYSVFSFKQCDVISESEDKTVRPKETLTLNDTSSNNSSDQMEEVHPTTDNTICVERDVKTSKSVNLATQSLVTNSGLEHSETRCDAIKTLFIDSDISSNDVESKTSIIPFGTDSSQLDERERIDIPMSTSRDDPLKAVKEAQGSELKGIEPCATNSVTLKEELEKKEELIRIKPKLPKQAKPIGIKPELPEQAKPKKIKSELPKITKPKVIEAELPKLIKLNDIKLELAKLVSLNESKPEVPKQTQTMPKDIKQELSKQAKPIEIKPELPKTKPKEVEQELPKQAKSREMQEEPSKHTDSYDRKLEVSKQAKLSDKKPDLSNQTNPNDINLEATKQAMSNYIVKLERDKNSMDIKSEISKQAKLNDVKSELPKQTKANDVISEDTKQTKSYDVVKLEGNKKPKFVPIPIKYGNDDKPRGAERKVERGPTTIEDKRNTVYHKVMAPKEKFKPAALSNNVVNKKSDSYNKARRVKTTEEDNGAMYPRLVVQKFTLEPSGCSEDSKSRVKAVTTKPKYRPNPVISGEKKKVNVQQSAIVPKPKYRPNPIKLEQAQKASAEQGVVAPKQKIKPVPIDFGEEKKTSVEATMLDSKRFKPKPIIPQEKTESNVNSEVTASKPKSKPMPVTFGEEKKPRKDQETEALKQRCQEIQVKLGHESKTTVLSDVKAPRSKFKPILITFGDDEHRKVDKFSRNQHVEARAPKRKFKPTPITFDDHECRKVDKFSKEHVEGLATKRKFKPTPITFGNDGHVKFDKSSQDECVRDRVQIPKPTFKPTPIMFENKGLRKIAKSFQEERVENRKRRFTSCLDDTGPRKLKLRY